MEKKVNLKMYRGAKFELNFSFVVVHSYIFSSKHGDAEIYVNIYS